MESLVLPIRKGDSAKQSEYEDFFLRRVSDMASLTRTVFDRAIAILAGFGFKTPDALHLAAAFVGGCDVFLTNDHQLRQYTGITVEVI
jgi:predicted nucleic acid-binding protein